MMLCNNIRRDTVATAAGKEFDEFYAYDGLHRLAWMTRGDSTGATCNFAQCWTLDPTGNWRGLREADGDCGSWDVVQTRTANAVNEITGITNTVGTPWSQPAYDPAGNMTAIPWVPPASPSGLSWANMTADDWAGLTADQWATLPVDSGSAPPPTGSLTAAYDAWNRLVKLVNAANAETVQENQYDARTFHIVRKDYVDGDLAETRRFIYTPGWRCVEERRVPMAGGFARQCS